MSRSKQWFLVTVLCFIALPMLLEVFHEIQEDEHDLAYLTGLAVVGTLALSGLAVLISEIRQRYRENARLRATLQSTHQDLQQANQHVHALTEKLRDTGKQYNLVVQEQFTAWGLTPSEREVALLLLKGLSFDEVASVRDTKEKTVRQQATTIYRKSGLNGRHEFAAWFFEDFLA